MARRLWGDRGVTHGAAGPPNSGKSTRIWDLLEVRELPDQPPDDVARVRRLRGPGAAGGRKNRGFLAKKIGILFLQEGLEPLTCPVGCSPWVRCGPGPWCPVGLEMSAGKERSWSPRGGEGPAGVGRGPWVPV